MRGPPGGLRRQGRPFLGIAHILVGLILLPISILFGILPAPLLALGPLWIVVLGVLLWRSGAKARTLARRTHAVALVFAVLLGIHGVLALEAAARSAAEGGGLFGTYGLIPIGYGILLGAFSVVSLLLTRPRES